LLGLAKSGTPQEFVRTKVKINNIFGKKLKFIVIFFINVINIVIIKLYTLKKAYFIIVFQLMQKYNNYQ
jgi:hypothetical protein